MSLYLKHLKSLLKRFLVGIFIFNCFLLGCVDDAPKPQLELEGEAGAEVTPDSALPDLSPLEPDVEPIPEDMEVTVEPDVSISCSEDGDCVEGVCDEGICTIECAEPSECDGLQNCIQGRCTDRCFGPGTCFRGGVCFNGVCIDPECEVDDECRDGLICRRQLCIPPDPCDQEDDCNSWERCVEGNCEPLEQCGGDLNCEADEICEDSRCRVRDVCERNDDCPDDQDCIAARCVPGLCRGEVDCALGEVCEAGACIEVSMELAERVLILNAPRSLIVEQTLGLRAVALNSEGQIISSEGFSWRVEPEDLGSIDALSGLFTAGPSDGEARVIATWISTAPEASPIDSAPLILPILPPPPIVEEGWRVRITDGSTGLPMTDATLYVDGDEYQTDPSGVATFNTESDRLTITVMSPDFDTITVVGATERAIHIPMNPLSDDSVIAGFTGEINFDEVQTNGQVEIGLAGGAFGDGISQISFLDLIGQLFFTEVDVGPVSATLPLPGGLVLNANVPFLGDFSIKESYQVLTQPGFQLGWSFGGRIAITTVLALLEGERISLGRVLGALLPFFDQFEHGVQVIPELVGLPPVPDIDDIDDDGNRRELVPDASNFPTINLSPNQEQNLRLAVDIPLTTEEEGDPITLVLTGVDMVDVGFVPLGLSATQEGGLIPMRMAPPYQGLQAGDYIVLALNGRFFNRIPRDISGLTQRFSRLPEQVNLADAYMALPDYSEWEPAFRRLSPDIPSEADLLRVSFRGGVGRWVIYFNPDALEPIRLPFPTDLETPDLTVGLDVRFDALDLMPGVTFNELLGEGGSGDLLQLDAFTERFSRRVDNGR